MNKCQTFQDVNEVQISVSTFEDQRLEQTDFAVIHDSPSTGAGPSIALFQNQISYITLDHTLYSINYGTWPCRDS